MLLKGVIYDLDGTIVYTAPVGVEAFLKTMKDLEIPQRHSVDEMIAIMEASLDNFLTTVLKGYEDLLPKVKLTWFNHFYELAFKQGKLKLAENIIEALIELRKRGYKLAIGTSNLGAIVELIVNHFNLDLYFDEIVTFDDVENPKPAPDAFLFAAKLLNLKPEQIITVGDLEIDVVASKNAGMRSVLYNPQSHKKDISKFQVKPDFVIENHSQLLEILNE
ncbi:MAG: HAD family hydrolase [Candidatus Odinarchaeota archaeon]|nr:HAD family hydrolase [Candidatus Odinarchaeota archaeon]